MSFGANRLGHPSGQEVRAALERIVNSPALRSSPQLAAFLKFIVESALSGHVEDIKGYTIAVKALGRSEDFNPKTDAIVRVEAGRLRRALERYYAETGADDPIGIEIPARGYVPSFTRRTVARAPARPPGQLRALARNLATNARRYAAALALVLLGAFVYGAVELWYFGNPLTRKQTFVTAGAPETTAQRWRGRPVGPVVFVEQIAVVGAPAAPAVTTAPLYDRLRDTFARFDDVTIVSDHRLAAGDVVATVPRVAPPMAPDYRFSSTIEYNSDNTFNLSFRVVDALDGTMVWSRTYEHLDLAADPRATKSPAVREVATTLFQQFGVIQARERIKLAVARDADPRYRCVVEASDYWRSFDPALHGGVRACFERAVAEDPTFAGGFALLASVYLREYQFGLGERPGDPAALERALQMARRAIELKPDSARAHYVLLDVLIARGAIAEGLAAGKTALALNPNDPTGRIRYAFDLIALGEIDEGTVLLDEISDTGAIRQTEYDFARFLASYLSDDIAKAATYADRLPTKTFPLGHLARTLVASKRADKTLVRQSLERLIELQPAWRADPRGELKKFFPSTKIVEELAQELARASTTALN